MSFTQNIQSVAPTLNINFTKSNRLDSRISFSRSGSGTYFNSQGILTTAPVNTPRFQNEFNSTLNRWVPKGLLVEESRTNKAGNSVIFHSASTVIPYYEVAPDGTLTALAYQPPNDPNVAGAHEKYFINVSITINVGDTVTIFAKRKPGSNLKFLGLRIFTSGWINIYNLETGTVSIQDSTMPGSMTNVGNGWWRCEFTNFASAGNANAIRLFVATNGSLGNATNGDPMYLWGLQSETGINSTSYISTFPLFSSRSTSATFYDSTGIIRTAAINVARNAAFLPDSSGVFRPVGLLVEEARTNFVKYSGNIFNHSGAEENRWSIIDSTVAGWPVPGHGLGGPGIGTLTQSAAIAPDGTLTASYFNAIGVNYLRSPFVGNGNQGQGLNAVTVNLSTGTITSANASASPASIASVGNGWYRISWNGAGVVGATSTCSIYAKAGETDILKLGFNAFFGGMCMALQTGGTASQGVYVWGAQIEAGSFPTSYIPTPATFTGRASTATFYDAAGVIQTAASGVARSNAFLPDSNGVMRPAGLLLEAAGTNLLTYSEQFNNNAAWSQSSTTITANAATAPDGTVTADLIMPNFTGTFRQTTQSFSVTSGVAYTFSCYVKSSGFRWCQLRLDSDPLNYRDTWFDLTNGVIGTAVAAAAIQKIGNNWFRISVSAVATSSGSVNFAFCLADANGSYTATANSPNGILAWGAQLETGPIATSYIPTVASTVTRDADTSTSATVTRAADITTSPTATRAADNVSISGSNFTNIHNPTENTLVSIGEENLYGLSSTALTINSNSKLNSTVSNLIYYPKTIQYASLNASKAYPAIVSSGLVLNLDAGNTKSYRTPGTTWRDLSGNSNTGTLTNGPSYNSANGGSIVFDGVDDRVTLGSPAVLTALFGTSAVSVDVWLRRSASITSQKIVFDSGTNEYIQMDINSNQLSFSIATPSAIRTARSATLDLDVWYHYVGVYNGSTITSYLNSIQSSQVAQTGNIATDSGGFFIASYTSGFNFPGRISSVKVYNRALSVAEVAQNFNATRRRYGI